MLARDLMSSHPTCCAESDTVQTAARLLKKHDIGSLPVVADQKSKKVVGIVTDRDLCCGILAEDRSPQTPVSAVMHANPVTCTANQSVEDCLEKMQEYQVRRLPVVDDRGTCIGMVAQADIALHCGATDVSETLAEISRSHEARQRVA